MVHGGEIIKSFHFDDFEFDSLLFTELKVNDARAAVIESLTVCFIPSL